MRVAERQAHLSRGYARKWNVVKRIRFRKGTAVVWHKNSNSLQKEKGKRSLNKECRQMCQQSKEHFETPRYIRNEIRWIRAKRENAVNSCWKFDDKCWKMKEFQERHWPFRSNISTNRCLADHRSPTSKSRHLLGRRLELNLNLWSIAMGKLSA